MSDVEAHAALRRHLKIDLALRRHTVIEGGLSFEDSGVAVFATDAQVLETLAELEAARALSRRVRTLTGI